ncbi:hypothetical protein DUNSADRAFT_5319, partial [Dunaliella salina]
ERVLGNRGHELSCVFAETRRCIRKASKVGRAASRVRHFLRFSILCLSAAGEDSTSGVESQHQHLRNEHTTSELSSLRKLMQGIQQCCVC